MRRPGRTGGIWLRFRRRGLRLLKERLKWWKWGVSRAVRVFSKKLLRRGGVLFGCVWGAVGVRWMAASSARVLGLAATLTPGSRPPDRVQGRPGQALASPSRTRVRAAGRGSGRGCGGGPGGGNWLGVKGGTVSRQPAPRGGRLARDSLGGFFWRVGDDGWGREGTAGRPRGRQGAGQPRGRPLRNLAVHVRGPWASWVGCPEDPSPISAEDVRTPDRVPRIASGAGWGRFCLSPRRGERAAAP